MTNVIARRIVVSGKVQGVSFRAFVCAEAAKIGVDGIVRNRKDGTVEALISGEQEKVEALIAQCRKGSPASQVENIQLSEAQGIVDKGFKQLPTV